MFHYIFQGYLPFSTIMLRFNRKMDQGLRFEGHRKSSTKKNIERAAAIWVKYKRI